MEPFGFPAKRTTMSWPEEMYQKSLTLFRELSAADRIAHVEGLLRKIGGGEGAVQRGQETTKDG